MFIAGPPNVLDPGCVLVDRNGLPTPDPKFELTSCGAGFGSSRCLLTCSSIKSDILRKKDNKTAHKKRSL